MNKTRNIIYEIEQDLNKDIVKILNSLNNNSHLNL
jgi:hypothetical protein